MSTVKRFAARNRTLLLKTASYYVMHISVAALVGYAVTGSLLMAITLSLLEPTVQAFAFFFHEKAWARQGRGVSSAAVAAPTPA